jgi:hypothetical protein
MHESCTRAPRCMALSLAQLNEYQRKYGWMFQVWVHAHRPSQARGAATMLTTASAAAQAAEVRPPVYILTCQISVYVLTRMSKYWRWGVRHLNSRMHNI